MPKKIPTAVVVIPTYNEAGSIGKMIDHLFTKTFPGITNWQMKLLIVDDTSPDGTYKIIQKKQKKYSDLHLLLNKQKAGIGTAYVKGFKYAMDKLKADVIFEFDGDFQHPPPTIPAMLQKIDEGADFVIGSRKIKGGSNPKGWGFMRWFFSAVGGGLVARFLLFFPYKAFWQITDPTTGLRATRVKGFLDKLNMTDLFSWSFAYKMQFLHDLVNIHHAKVAEVPLKFQLRNVDRSKIEPSTAKDIFRVTILSRLHDPTTAKFIKFGTVGFVGYLVNASLLFFISKTSSPEWLAWALSTEAAIISNFTLNNIWTFKKDQITGIGKLISKFFQFNLTSAGALIIQTVAGTAGVAVFGPQYRQLLLPVIIVFLVLPYNWLMYNKIIWKKKKKK